MEIGISTGLFYNRDLIDVLPLFKNAGFDSIEIAIGESEWGPFSFSYYYDKSNKNDELNLLQRKWRVWRLKVHALCLREKLQECDIRVHSLHIPFSKNLDISSLDDAKRQGSVFELKKGIDLASFLNAGIAIVHPGGELTNFRDHDEKKRRLDKCAQSVGEILKYASQKNIILAMENLLPHMVCGYSDDILSIVNGFNSDYVKICFDSSHANLAENPVEVLKKFNGKVVTVHLSDNQGKYDEHLMPGDGNINYPMLIKALKDINYQGVFMMEVLHHKDKDAPEQTLLNIKEKALELLGQQELV